MGLNKRAQGNFVRIKDGKFYLGKNLDEPYDELTGKITNMSFKDDEFEGKTIRKLVVTLEDGEDFYTVSFPFDSSYSSTFVSFLKNADLSEPVTLVPVAKEEDGKKSRTLLVSQDGTFMKSYYTKDHKHGQPDFKKKTKKSGAVEWDKEDFLEFRENVILNELLPQIQGEEQVDKTKIVTEEDTEETNDLPF